MHEIQSNSHLNMHDGRGCLLHTTVLAHNPLNTAVIVFIWGIYTASPTPVLLCITHPLRPKTTIVININTWRIITVRLSAMHIDFVEAEVEAMSPKRP